MNKKDFGALIRALREDHLDEYAHQWTRKTLSREMEKHQGVVLNEDTIGKIELGLRRNITPQELVSFANALQLTTIERQEFFHASIGTDAILATGKDTQLLDEILKKHINSLQGTGVPFFICDQYNDIVAANQAVIQLLNFTPEKIQEAIQHPIGFNIMRIVFDSSSGFQNLISNEIWDDLAFFEIQWFRGDTLQYRNAPYFKYLLNHLLQLREFRWRWREVYWEQDDWYGRYRKYNYIHPEGGAICYGAIHSRALTPIGPLITIMYIPHTLQTSTYFDMLMENGGGDIQLFPTWPKKQCLT